jgi:hypothetical protein
MPRKPQALDNRASLTPNHFPNPVTDEEMAAAITMCRYLGGLYPEGSRICWADHRIWECQGGQWQPTPDHC